MNNRIKELAELAMVTVTKQVRDGGWDNDRPPFTFHYETEVKFSEEEFARLIIEECIQVCKAGAMTEFTAPGITQCVEDIRKHFGVKDEK